MLLNLNGNDKVAGRRPAKTRLAVALNAELTAGGNARRDIDIEFFVRGTLPDPTQTSQG